MREVTLSVNETSALRKQKLLIKALQRRTHGAINDFNQALGAMLQHRDLPTNIEIHQMNVDVERCTLHYEEPKPQDDETQG